VSDDWAATRKHEQTAACFFVQLFVNRSVLQLLIQLLHLELALLQLLREIFRRRLRLREGELIRQLFDFVGVPVLPSTLQVALDNRHSRLGRISAVEDLAMGALRRLDLPLRSGDRLGSAGNLSLERLQLRLITAHSETERESELK